MTTTITFLTARQIPEHIRPMIQRGSFACFRDPRNAFSFADGCCKPHCMVLGDIDEDGENGQFWVVLPADAQRLVRAGYELAGSHWRM